jgi:hypothetical protein
MSIFLLIQRYTVERIRIVEKSEYEVPVPTDSYTDVVLDTDPLKQQH